MNCLLMRELSLDAIIRIWDTELSEENGFETFHVYLCAAFLFRFSTILRTLAFQELVLFLQVRKGIHCPPCTITKLYRYPALTFIPTHSTLAFRNSSSCSQVLEGDLSSSNPTHCSTPSPTPLPTPTSTSPRKPCFLLCHEAVSTRLRVLAWSQPVSHRLGVCAFQPLTVTGPADARLDPQRRGADPVTSPRPPLALPRCRGPLQTVQHMTRMIRS